MSPYISMGGYITYTKFGSQRKKQVCLVLYVSVAKQNRKGDLNRAQHFFVNINRAPKQNSPKKKKKRGEEWGPG